MNATVLRHRQSFDRQRLRSTLQFGAIIWKNVARRIFGEECWRNKVGGMMCKIHWNATINQDSCFEESDSIDRCIGQMSWSDMRIPFLRAQCSRVTVTVRRNVNVVWRVYAGSRSQLHLGNSSEVYSRCV